MPGGMTPRAQQRAKREAREDRAHASLLELLPDAGIARTAHEDVALAAWMARNPGVPFLTLDRVIEWGAPRVRERARAIAIAHFGWAP